MAHGRMIQKRISQNRDLPRLLTTVNERLGVPHGAQAVILYTWCIAHLDVAGRMHGDPSVVRGTVIPRFPHIQDADVYAYLRAMAEIGIVTYYEAKGDFWLSFPAFDDSQPHLRKDRETPSKIPAPKGCRIIAGVPPSTAGEVPTVIEDQDQEKGREGNSGKCDPRKVQDAWLRITGVIATSGLLDVAIACEEAAAAQKPPAAPDQYAEQAIETFVTWVGKCPPDRKPQIAPRKFIEHFGRIQELMAKGRPTESGAARLARISMQESGE